MWGSWARYVVSERPGRFAKLAVNVMGAADCGDDMQTALKGIEAMEAFYRSINMPASLKELGIDPTDAQMKEMAEKCCFWGRRTVGCLKALHAEDVYKIYKEARVRK